MSMEQKCRICPWWMGYFLLIPFRKYRNNPEKILSKHIKPGMNIMDYGSAMGFFSLPMAKMTGENGKVYCVDIQEKMLEKLNLRARKAGVGNIIKTCNLRNGFNMNQLDAVIDFVMLFAVVHEVPDKEKLFKDLFLTMKPNGKVLFAEPIMHVSTEAFEESLKWAKAAGFKLSEEKPMPNGLCVFLIK